MFRIILLATFSIFLFSCKNKDLKDLSPKIKKILKPDAVQEEIEEVETVLDVMNQDVIPESPTRDLEPDEFEAFEMAPNLIIPEKINPQDLPNNLKYEGKIKEAFKWTDQMGEHIVITTETGKYKSKSNKYNNDERDAELFSYHYILKNGKPEQLWKVYDFVKNCPVDIEASFIKNTFNVTDLNEDGIAEIWLMYRVACRGDVSPATTKIIMYEGKQKYAMRGDSRVVIDYQDNGSPVYYGGNYKADQAFTSGPKVFLTYAKDLWEENVKENWD